MARLRDNFARGTLTLDVSDSATNLTSEEFFDLIEISSPDICVLVLDPLGFFGDPEIVYVTDHGAGATPNQNVTVTRGQEGTVAREHPAGTRWVNTATALDFNRKEIQATVVDYTTDVATGDGQWYIHIGELLDGKNLTYVHAEVITAGTTGTLDIQIHNVTSAADILSTKLTVNSGETGSDTATAAVIDTDEDDVVLNDLLRIDIDAVQTTAPQGLIVTLGFE